MKKSVSVLIALCFVSFFYGCQEDTLVVEEVFPAFVLSDSIVNQGESIQFTNTTNGEVESLEWSFQGGNPSTSSAQAPTVSFPTSGIYEVALTATNGFKSSGNVVTKQIVVLPNQDLVAYYPFDESADDASGNNYNGTLLNGVGNSENRFGVAKKAFLFSLGANVETTTAIDDNLSEGASFSAWIKLTDTADGIILSNYNGTGVSGNCNERVGFSFGVKDEQQLYISYATGENNYDGRISGLGTLALDSWYHVAGTWNGTFNAEGFSLYINGLKSDVSDFETGSEDCGGFLESVNPLKIGIGTCAAGECAPFNGAIDEVRIYSRVLTDIEILALAKG